MQPITLSLSEYVAETRGLDSHPTSTEATFYPAIKTLLAAILKEGRLPFEVRVNTSEAKGKTHALCDKYDGMDMPDQTVVQFERIGAAIEAMQKEEYRPRDIALAGAFATLAHDGSVRVERGFVHADDDPASKAKADEKNGKRPAKDADGLALLSEKLVAELAFADAVAILHAVRGPRNHRRTRSA